MPEIRQYQIPELGCFGITHLEKTLNSGSDLTEPGYYGTRGCGFITQRCESVEEAEEELSIAISTELFNQKAKYSDQVRQINAKITLLKKIGISLAESSSLRKYLVPATNLL